MTNPCKIYYLPAEDEDSWLIDSLFLINRRDNNEEGAEERIPVSHLLRNGFFIWLFLSPEEGGRMEGNGRPDKASFSFAKPKGFREG